MQFLHYNFYAGPDDVVLVRLDRSANVRLLDDCAFQNYRTGSGSYRYFGGLARSSPVRLTPPRYGHWNLTVDLGAQGGSVRASVRVVPLN